jgi:hypothetical protein
VEPSHNPLLQKFWHVAHPHRPSTTLPLALHGGVGTRLGRACREPRCHKKRLWLTLWHAGTLSHHPSNHVKRVHHKTQCLLMHCCTTTYRVAKILPMFPNPHGMLIRRDATEHAFKIRSWRWSPSRSQTLPHHPSLP